MDFIFLAASTPITKTFVKKSNGTIEKTSYPNIYEVTSKERSAKNLGDFEAILRSHAKTGDCLLKGKVSRPLISESRAGTTDSNATTEWICLDIDGLPGCPTVEAFLKHLGLQDISYVVQYSASYKVENNDLRAHVFMFLNQPVAAPLLKQWLIDLNRSTPILRQNISLTKTDNALRYPLDISVCQNDKLIYIATPNFKGMADPLGKTLRIEYVHKAHNVFAFPVNAVTNISANRDHVAKIINELREAKGLPKKKIVLKTDGQTEYMSKPDAATAFETKTERGFTYFNLNGGDSWGYYHPEDNAKYIFNFKGEPTYLTEELLPDYWQQIHKPAPSTPGSIQHLAFCDRKSSTYWRGTYDPTNNVLDLNLARTSKQVIDYMKANNIMFDEFIPEWDLVFDPHDTVRVDFTNRVVNLFEPTKYMQAVAKKVAAIPPLVNRVVSHALGGDPKIVKHFINWLAYIVQYRDRTGTSWVLHGTTGTGKGVLMNHILRPLFGTAQTTIKRMEELNEPYNSFMKQCFIVFVDEMQSRALTNEDNVMAKLRSFITEPTVPIRAMYQTAVEQPNFTNWIFASNKPDPQSIPKEDRRTNVGTYQRDKLQITPQEIDSIEKELQAFHNFLLYYKIDLVAVKTPIDSVDRDNMISISESSIDTVGSALIEGNFAFFIDQLPTTNTYTYNALEFNKVESYKEVLISMMARTLPNGVCNISREELRTLFEYAVGNIPSSPNKFTSLLKHHRIHITRVRINNVVAGITTTWKDVKKFSNYQEYFVPVAPAQPGKLKVVK